MAVRASLKLTKEEKEIFLKKKLNPKSKKEKRKEYLLQKEDARKLVEQKLLFWKKYYYENFSINLEYKRVAIKNSVSRWGSCSSKKNLNFSYKIISLKEEEQDYLIVHELCHLLEMNHGENFWKLVSMGVPKYKDLRKKLRMGIF
jgi:predicted metal-dependent hydrolase